MVKQPSLHRQGSLKAAMALACCALGWSYPAIPSTITPGQTKTFNVHKGGTVQADVTGPGPVLIEVREGGLEVSLEAGIPEDADSGLGPGAVEWVVLEDVESLPIRLRVTGPHNVVGDVSIAVFEISTDEFQTWRHARQLIAQIQQPEDIKEAEAGIIQTEAFGRPRLTAQLFYQLGQAAENRKALETALRIYRRAFDSYEALNLPGWQARVAIDRARAMFGQGQLEGASTELGVAKALALGASQPRWGLTAAANQCRVLSAMGATERARACTVQAIESPFIAGLPEALPALQLNLAALESALGNPTAARKALGRAESQFLTLGDTRGQAQVLMALGTLDRRVGQAEKAIAAFQRAMDIYKELGDRRRIASVQHSLGVAYLAIGKASQGQRWLESAIAFPERANNTRAMQVSLTALAQAHATQGRQDLAFDHRERALGLAEQVDDAELIANARIAMGRSWLALDEPKRALEISELVIAQNLELPRTVARAQTLRGDSLRLLHQAEKAEHAYRAALESSSRRGAALERLAILTALSQLALEQKNPKAAGNWLREANRVHDELRVRLSNPVDRAAFSASSIELRDIEIKLHLGDGTGSVEKAFLATERWRARSLRDVLSQSEQNRFSGGEHNQLTEIRAALNLAITQLEALQASGNVGAAEGQEAKVDELYNEFTLQETAARVARARPAMSAQLSIELTDIQNMLAPNTALLEFVLSEPESLLWVITRDTIQDIRLPDRQTIEALAIEVHERFRSSNEDASDLIPLQRKLGELLLGSIPDLGNKRQLLIVPDGALHYVSFAALIAPGRSAPIIDSTIISYLPSAQTVIDLRERPTESTPNKTMLMIADPVFAKNDRRVRSRKDVLRGPSLDRLPLSGVEAKTIAEMVPDSEVDIWTDFQARRDRFLNAKLGDYRIVHLATHGTLNTAFPELSGITLSTVDANGESIDGFIGLYDLFLLPESANMIVLSACDTALGAELRGEGLMGLTRGFMFAGTRQVVATLWQVQDRATMGLMEHFYEGLFEGQKSPAAALAAAQNTIRQEPGMAHPFFWAGVSLHGDWN